ncbi:hypothetical protein ACVILL_006498 [Bradyrhizobium sp. USDA 3364]
MKRSAIREIIHALRAAPDFASLHPGYEGHFSVAVSVSENASSVRSSLSGVTET